MSYYGDFLSGEPVCMYWDTATAAGASVTRATNGTVYVKRRGGSAVTTGITDTEDAVATGIHEVQIATTDSYFTPGDYSVYVTGSEIDGQTVNHYIGSFSIQNRYYAGLVARGVCSGAGTSTTIVGPSAMSFANDIPNAATVFVSYGTGFGQARPVDDFVGATDTFTISPALQTTTTTSSYIEVLATSPASTTVASFPKVDLGAINGTSVASAAAGYMPSVMKVGGGAGELLITDGKVATQDVTLTSATIDSIWDEVVEGSTTVRQGLRGILSVLLGKVARSSTSWVSRDLADTKNRVSANTDANGARDSVTRDLS